MLNFENVIDLQLIMFLLMMIGIVLRKKDIIDENGRKNMTDLLIDIILPCNIICSFMIEMNHSILISSAVVLLIAFVVQLIAYLLGKVIYFKVPERQKKVLQYATMCSNAGFMGNPIIEGIYGSMGLLYASVYLIPLRFFMWSAGLSCFTKTNLKDTLKKLALHPCIIAVWIGFAVMIFQIPLPGFLSKTLKHLSNCNLPISIIIIGTILAEVDFRTIISKLTLYYSFIRLIFMPAVVLGLCMLFSVEPLITGVAVVLTGMPAGSTTAILAEKYDGDAKYASKAVFLTTFLSLFTIPVLCMIVERLT